MQRRVFGTYIKKINAKRYVLEKAVRKAKAIEKARLKKLGDGGGRTPKPKKQKKGIVNAKVAMKKVAGLQGDRIVCHNRRKFMMCDWVLSLIHDVEYQ